VRLWDLSNGQLIETLDMTKVDDRPGGVAFAPDGQSLLVGTARGVLLRFELVTPR
jgi:hypothetical protein